MPKTETAKPTPTPYRVYDIMTGEELGRYETYDMGYLKHPEGAIVRYMPSKRKVVK